MSQAKFTTPAVLQLALQKVYGSLRGMFLSLCTWDILFKISDWISAHLHSDICVMTELMQGALGISVPQSSQHRGLGLASPLLVLRLPAGLSSSESL